MPCPPPPPEEKEDGREVVPASSKVSQGALACSSNWFPHLLTPLTGCHGLRHFGVPQSNEEGRSCYFYTPLQNKKEAMSLCPGQRIRWNTVGMPGQHTHGAELLPPLLEGSKPGRKKLFGFFVLFCLFLI